VPGVSDGPDSRFDGVGTIQFVKGSTNGLPDEVAAIAWTNALVHRFNQGVIEAYVQAHGHSIAHTCAGRSDVDGQ
jgi:hypothetical protein